jgi:hypothetical protein
MVNTDRHEANILVQKHTVVLKDPEDDKHPPASEKGTSTKRKHTATHKQVNYKLLPIDHGMCLPDCLEMEEYEARTKRRLEYIWMGWPHKDRPFSRKTLDYIKNIDIMGDIRLLDLNLHIRPICLFNMRVSCTLLQRGAAAGLNIGQIGRIWCRAEDGEFPSELERLVERARQQVELSEGNLRPPHTRDPVLNASNSATRAQIPRRSRANTDIFELNGETGPSDPHPNVFPVPISP